MHWPKESQKTKMEKIFVPKVEINPLSSLNKEVIALKNQKLLRYHAEDILKKLALHRMFYISHPSLASLECTMNFLNYSEDIFNFIFSEMLKLANFNPEEVEKNYSSFSISFKDVAAMKLLNIIFKDNEDHALHKLYQKWLGKSEILRLIDLTR